MWVFIENELFDGGRIPPPPNFKEPPCKVALLVTAKFHKLHSNFS